MNANELAAALGAKRRGREWVARCPAHDDHTPSLWFRDGDRALVLNCRARCENAEVIDALKARGLWHAKPYDRRRPVPIKPVEHKPDPAALKEWRSAQCADDTIVEHYLLNRGITRPIPPTIRAAGTTMVVAVQAPDRRVIAIQTTKLTSSATKAPVSVPRLTTGELGYGAVRLAQAGDVLGLAEGPETALSAMQIFGVPVWVSLGSKRLPKVFIPAHVRHLIIFADNDDAGRIGAELTAEIHRKRRVEVRFPPNGYNDWNDVLQGGAA